MNCTIYTSRKSRAPRLYEGLRSFQQLLKLILKDKSPWTFLGVRWKRIRLYYNNTHNQMGTTSCVRATHQLCPSTPLEAIQLNFLFDKEDTSGTVCTTHIVYVCVSNVRACSVPRYACICIYVQNNSETQKGLVINFAVICQKVGTLFF